VVSIYGKKEERKREKREGGRREGVRGEMERKRENKRERERLRLETRQKFSLFYEPWKVHKITSVILQEPLQTPWIPSLGGSYCSKYI